MSWCKGSIVTSSTKVCYPCGIAAPGLIPEWPLPSCFWRNPLGRSALSWCGAWRMDAKFLVCRCGMIHVGVLLPWRLCCCHVGKITWTEKTERVYIRFVTKRRWFYRHFPFPCAGRQALVYCTHSTGVNPGRERGGLDLLFIRIYHLVRLNENWTLKPVLVIWETTWQTFPYNFSKCRMYIISIWITIDTTVCLVYNRSL